MASSISFTTLADIIRSLYSVPQSSSFAGTAPPSSINFLSPLISTFFSLRAFVTMGMNLSAMASCTRRLSHALHTPGLWVFAFITIFTAISKSALSSTYVWQFPVPVSITGTVLFNTTDWISPAPPLGISTSI